MCLVLLPQGREVDELILDLSPLRTPEQFHNIAQFCLSQPDFIGGRLEAKEMLPEGEDHTSLDAGGEGSDRQDQTSSHQMASSAVNILKARADDFLTLPIYRLPMYALSWERPRSEAKANAKALAQLLKTASETKGRPKQLGGPKVKPGKSRRHGGYGIG